VIDTQADHRALDDRKFVRVITPGGPPGQQRMQPIPRLCGRPAVQAGISGRHRLFGAPGGRVAEGELATMFGWSPGGAGYGCRDWSAQDAVGAHPTENLDGQVSEQESDAGCVVAGIQHYQNVRVACLPLAGGDESLHDLADLRGGHGGDIGAGCQSDGVQ
jgi:hypothetical protein